MNVDYFKNRVELFFFNILIYKFSTSMYAENQYIKQLSTLVLITLYTYFQTHY